jgi:NADH-quinone oxidoreductase subunit I
VNIFRKTIHGIKGLLSGMGLTFHYFSRPSQVITQQYPENRETLELPPRFRGRIELVKDPQTGHFLCTACGLCLKACPNNSIALEKIRNPETKKMQLVKYEYRFDRCTLCGFCVDVCKFEALRMGNHFETAVFDRNELTQNLTDDSAPGAAPGPAAGQSQTPAPPATGDQPAAPEPPKGPP